MIQIEFTPDELLYLIQGLSSRKKIFRSKISNNRNLIADGRTELTADELEHCIVKRERQMDKIDTLKTRLEHLAFANGVEPIYEPSQHAN